MAIDADLNAGLIDEDEARRRRERRRRARPTSTARWTAPRSSSRATPSPAIIITVVNLIGGFVIGVVQQRHAARRGASSTYTPAHRRRRPRLADPGAAHLDRDRHHRHPRGLARTTSAATSSGSSRASARRRCVAGGGHRLVRARARHAQAAVPGHRRPLLPRPTRNHQRARRGRRGRQQDAAAAAPPATPLPRPGLEALSIDPRGARDRLRPDAAGRRRRRRAMLDRVARCAGRSPPTSAR